MTEHAGVAGRGHIIDDQRSVAGHRGEIPSFVFFGHVANDGRLQSAPMLNEHPIETLNLIGRTILIGMIDSDEMISR